LFTSLNLTLTLAWQSAVDIFLDISQNPYALPVEKLGSCAALLALLEAGEQTNPLFYLPP